MNARTDDRLRHRRTLLRSGAIAGVLAILIEVLLPLAFDLANAAAHAADPFAASICHGGSVSSDPVAGDDIPVLPHHDGGNGTSCCPVFPAPLAQPSAAHSDFSRALPARPLAMSARIDDRNRADPALRGFRSRAPPGV